LLLAATKTITSLTIEATTTMIANEEKKIGELWINGQYFEMERNPAAKDFKPKLNRLQYTHTLSDGGVTNYIIDDKFESQYKLNYVSVAEEANIRSLFDLEDVFVITPEPTGTSWNSKIYEVNWIGGYSFETYADNYKGNGYKGQFTVKETPS